MTSTRFGAVGLVADEGLVFGPVGLREFRVADCRVFGLRS